LPTNAGIRTTLVDAYNILAVFQALVQRVHDLRRKGTAFDFREDAKEKFGPAPQTHNLECIDFLCFLRRWNYINSHHIWWAMLTRYA